MPPNMPDDRRIDADPSAKRCRKSVERLSSSKLQANQYSPLILTGFGKDDGIASSAREALIPAPPRPNCSATPSAFSGEAELEVVVEEKNITTNRSHPIV